MHTPFASGAQMHAPRTVQYTAARLPYEARGRQCDVRGGNGVNHSVRLWHHGAVTS